MNPDVAIFIENMSPRKSWYFIERDLLPVFFIFLAKCFFFSLNILLSVGIKVINRDIVRIMKENTGVQTH